MLLAFEDRIAIEGPPIKIGSEAAQQISLALHELATNAQKYNLLSSTNTRVRVSWRTDESGRFVLCWNENLSRSAAEEMEGNMSNGFGTKLLTRIVPTMLRGEASREVTADSLSYCLTLPLSAVLPPEEAEFEAISAARLVDETFGLA